MSISPRAEPEGRTHSEKSQSPGARAVSCLELGGSSLAKTPSASMEQEGMSGYRKAWATVVHRPQSLLQSHLQMEKLKSKRAWKLPEK